MDGTCVDNASSAQGRYCTVCMYVQPRRSVKDSSTPSLSWTCSVGGRVPVIRECCGMMNGKRRGEEREIIFVGAVS